MLLLRIHPISGYIAQKKPYSHSTLKFILMTVKNSQGNLQEKTGWQDNTNLLHFIYFSTAIGTTTWAAVHMYGSPPCLNFSAQILQ